MVMRRGLRGVWAVRLKRQHLQRRDGCPCAQAKSERKYHQTARWVHRVWDVSEAVSALARWGGAKQCGRLCRLCEVKPHPSLSRLPPPPPHPITIDRPHISERVFHLYGPVCAPQSALILRARLPLPGATTRGPRAALSPQVLFFASISSRARRASNPLPRATRRRYSYHGTLLRDSNSWREEPEGRLRLLRL